MKIQQHSCVSTLDIYVFNILIFFSSACAIHLQDNVIITGGKGCGKCVQAYDLGGPVDLVDGGLPNLLTGRYDHGCGTFITNNGEIVSIL